MLEDHNDLAGSLYDMCGLAMLAACMAMRDSDLPKDDVVGEIDAGVAENLLRMAVARAKPAVESAGEGAFSGGMARLVPLRQTWALLASDNFLMDHHRGGLLNDLLEAASTIAQTGGQPQGVQRFDDLFLLSRRVFLRSGRTSQPHRCGGEWDNDRGR